MTTVLKGTRPAWSGDYKADRGYSSPEEWDGHCDFTDVIPDHFTTLDRLQAGRPARRGGAAATGSGKPSPMLSITPADRRACTAREKVCRARYDEELAQRKRARAKEGERWATEPPSESDPAPEVASCERCGQPITDPVGEDDALFAPPEDGRHCPTCRTDLRQPLTLRGALFGRWPRKK
ncbi:hypothetical protein [Streptomyces sp. NBC_00687]|uniref:hypothetical protein n=1 Tax=Streptomyces sp. NBC_00687 TaxID=2975807 RepID=UPI002256CAC4|nr:hypothetical protein [Streptomyces sp. NBC_00687]MCX4912055.1 hypothetical protein [Streptomyces sp. NBC_00687]